MSARPDPLTNRLRLGTRPGAVATSRGAAVARRLLELDPSLALEQQTVTPVGQAFDPSMRTEHDPDLAAALRESLLRGEVDLAVHAMKDLPPGPPPSGLRLAAVPPREDPRDCLVATRFARLEEMPAGARVGVDGAAREVALRRLLPGLTVVRALGPLAERVTQVERGELDGIVVALAALRRIGLHGRRVAQVFGFSEVLPAAGQGAGAVEIRAQETDLGLLLNNLDHHASRWCVLAEREFEEVGAAGGALVVGAYAEVRDMQVHLRARLACGEALVQGAEIAPVDRLEGLGRGLAQRLLRELAAVSS